MQIIYLDDFFLGARQSNVSPVEAFTLGGATPHGIRIAGALLLMHRNHAGPHKEDAHVHINASICTAIATVKAVSYRLLKCRATQSGSFQLYTATILNPTNKVHASTLHLEQQKGTSHHCQHTQLRCTH